ncbi:uncharacterized protein LOC132258659 isoform X2 [Phlebotomus argentipes]|uniref:uncharacterized protein LOC132258659 isoform X2 n=1 Tax=Phlebotomus argentipes TaxID=94469 RepID=UPI0028932079|nr:uncharacterized protein LOC132258659 isoform X2 [Phlebotomus argentipes]
MRNFGASTPHEFNASRPQHVMPQPPSRPMRFPSDRLRSVLLIASLAILLAIDGAKGDNDNGGDLLNGYSLGPEITTTEFDYTNRGNRKFGDKCDVTNDCGFPGSICDSKKKSCQCVPELPATNHIDKCGKEAAINESCFFNEQCEALNFQTECRDGRCICRFEMSPVVNKDGSIECKGKNEPIEPVTYVDPAMIGVLVGMALMFVIICVVLRLFSRARWRENRTIFNTPNPRLMNVSLLRENKLLHGQERRGSRMSVRVPSRQPSMASLRPHSPSASLGSRRGSRGSSNASATSTKSNRSTTNIPASAAHNNQHPDLRQVQARLANNTPPSIVESVTVEITEPKA